MAEWHSLSSGDWIEQALEDVIQRMLIGPVTHWLPPGWQNLETIAQAQAWIEKRDREGSTLLVIERSSRKPIGLVILFEIVSDGMREIRLGYLLARSVWGRGLATELIRGLVNWCRQTDVSTLVGGVARENVPSRRVLEKLGFICDSGTQNPEELFYRLDL